MRRNEHRDPYPLTWELPAAAVALLLVTLVVGAHLGRAAANVLAGRGLAFPAQADVLRSVPRLLGGDADAGLSGLVGAPPSRTLLWAAIAVVEVLLLVACGWLTKTGVQQFQSDTSLTVYLQNLQNTKLTPTDDPTWDTIKLAVQQQIGAAVGPDGDPKAVLDKLQAQATSGG